MPAGSHGAAERGASKTVAAPDSGGSPDSHRPHAAGQQPPDRRGGCGAARVLRGLRITTLSMAQERRYGRF